MSYRAIRRKNIRDNEDPSINLTPLIDVVFSILIMFIVIAPLLELDRIILADHSTDGAEQRLEVKEQSQIAIQVDQNNNVWVNRKQVALPQLTPALKEEKRKYPAARPQLYPDKRAHFGTYQSVKNSLESAGFEEMDIVLKPQ